MAAGSSALLNRREEAAGRDTQHDRVAGYEVASVRKALEILCAFTPQTPTWNLSGLSRTLGIPKSTAHNLIRTLESFGCIWQNHNDKRYALGPKIHDLGLVFSQTTELLDKALPLLGKLGEQTEETVKLGVLSGGQVLVIAAVESAHLLHTRGDVGGRWSLYSTSLGKAILAQLPFEEVRRLFGRRRLPAFTPRTITSIEKLEQELEQVRARGYALDWEENEPGVHCVAVGLRDGGGRQTVAAVSISGPAVRITEKTVALHAARVGEAVAAIAAAMHWSVR